MGYVRKMVNISDVLGGVSFGISVKAKVQMEKSHFIYVTKLTPCFGVRIGESTLDLSASERALQVTSKMVHIPSRQAPRQALVVLTTELGSQTEQVPPTAVFQLGPEDMRGFRFLIISVAPCPTISGRPPPAASTAVGQFFNPQEGEIEFSPHAMLLSTYSPKEMFLKEDHPLTFNLSFAISLGLFAATLSLKTESCGIKKAGLPDEETGNMENSSPKEIIQKAAQGVWIMAQLRAKGKNKWRRAVWTKHPGSWN
ncbi:uncharacterized protein LOC123197760 isoform X1 [Mangifera indica]|uniref:uncharacterized protein LOC123197760 isoform X1 n=1 Tax=Mangifera indica TaxID=29780 RepID=UPI001CFB489E|nr:uncharacterized protein LOC123197760 isoform X1 [Mangifera indica]